MSRRFSPNEVNADFLEKAKEQWYARVRKRNIGVFLGFLGLAASICIHRKYGSGHVGCRQLSCTLVVSLFPGPVTHLT